MEPRNSPTTKDYISSCPYEVLQLILHYAIQGHASTRRTDFELRLVNRAFRDVADSLLWRTLNVNNAVRATLTGGRGAVEKQVGGAAAARYDATIAEFDKSVRALHFSGSEMLLQSLIPSERAFLTPEAMATIYSKASDIMSRYEETREVRLTELYLQRKREDGSSYPATPLAWSLVRSVTSGLLNVSTLEVSWDMAASSPDIVRVVTMAHSLPRLRTLTLVVLVQHIQFIADTGIELDPLKDIEGRGKIKNLNFIGFNIPRRVIKQLILWPRKLSSLQFEFGNTGDEYGWSQEQLQELLDPLGPTLKSLSMGPFRGGEKPSDKIFYSPQYTEPPPNFSDFTSLTSLKLTNWALYNKVESLSLNVFSSPNLKHFAIVHFQQGDAPLEKSQLEVVSEEITLSVAHYSPLEEVHLAFDCNDRTQYNDLAACCKGIAEQLAPRIKLKQSDSQDLLKTRYANGDHEYLAFMN